MRIEGGESSLLPLLVFGRTATFGRRIEQNFATQLAGRQARFKSPDGAALASYRVAQTTHSSTVGYAICLVLSSKVCNNVPF